MAYVRNIVFAGDSTSSTWTNAYSYGNGGTGTYIQRYAETLNRHHSPILGSGFYGMWLGTNGFVTAPYGWVTQSGSWTTDTVNTVDDRAPFASTMKNSTGGQIRWTKPLQMSAAAGFAVYWIDATGTGNWQYSIDGGSRVSMGETRLGDHLLKKFYIPTAVNQYVDFFANDGSSNCLCLLAGIESYRLDPRSHNGIIVHSLGYVGNYVHQFVRQSSTLGDPMAFLDAVVLGTNAVSNQPAELYGMFTNDYLLQSIPGWTSDWSVFAARAQTYATVTLMAHFEQYGLDLTGVTIANTSPNITMTGGGSFTATSDGADIVGTNIPADTTISSHSDATHAIMSKNATGVGSGTATVGRSPTFQASMRTALLGVSTFAHTIDFYTLWAHQYGAGWANANSAGLMTSDANHASDIGQKDQAVRVRWAG